VVLCGPDPARESSDATKRDATPKDDSEPREAVFIQQWHDSDTEEQRVLAQLAIDRHPSPHRDNCATMGHLARRGLLDPCTLAIRDRHFAAFIASEYTAADLDWHERDEGPNAWKTLRLPLATAGSAVLAMLAQASPELQATGIIFPAVFAAMQVVLRALGSHDPPPRTSGRSASRLGNASLENADEDGAQPGEETPVVNDGGLSRARREPGPGQPPSVGL
jgi:hypothetical protein